MPDSHRRRTVCATATILVAAPAAIAPPSAWAVALVAVLAMAVAILRRPPGPVSPVQAAGLVAVLSVAVTIGYPGRQGLVLPWLPFEFASMLVLAGRVVRRADVRQAALVGSALTLALMSLPLRFTLRLPQAVLAPSVVAVALAMFPAACAVGVGLYLRANDDRRVRAVQRARREQRLEVARDLHDFVAHEVTGILLEVQAAQVGSYDEEQTRELLGRLEAAGLRALDSMDHTLQTLRDPEAPAAAEPPPTKVHGLADLPELVDRFLASGTVGGVLDLEPGLAGTAPREIEDAAYRVVLEALTNIRRHAPSAGRLAVEVVRTDGPALRVTVTDSGRQGGSGGLSARRPGGGGTGLAALSERITALGGDLAAGPHAGGWRVCGVLPLRPAPAAPAVREAPAAPAVPDAPGGWETPDGRDGWDRSDRLDQADRLDPADRPDQADRQGRQ
ncbi:sensor histidine kinase [Streptomyces sp. NRRL S-350]|uniref:sensor histidine kinase n=1 Tax=Streptomyces sp. NRRL S-350 TaxID=1463902 RepID=UPI001F2A1B78|nr:histidine kinase [Streptomyces sp. NRRL S-350]